MNFAEVLIEVRNCPGVVATAIADRDGIPVECWGGSRKELEDIIAEYSTLLREVVSANRELQLGALEQVVITGASRQVQITLITEEYFLMAIVDRLGNTGKARFKGRVAASKLRFDFV